MNSDDLNKKNKPSGYIRDTIAAISSGLSKSGIGVIRVSGLDSRHIVESIFTSKSGNGIKLSEPQHIYYGFIRNVSRETSDEVLVLNMPAPHSFTGEDVVEIDCHGGILMMQQVLEAVILAGARNAEPGEFTKRAFLNGRIDLAQAESVIDIINAVNDNAIRSSVSQLGGRLSKQIRTLREDILEQAAFIEAALDDPEHYSLDGYADKLKIKADDICTRLDRLISGFERGRRITNGIETVILGRPNAGKSSLMNALLGEDRAIVTRTPGTTRDAIRETVTIGNVTLKLTDTAGLRKSEDEIEQIGINKALDNAERAELILCVADGADTDNSKQELQEIITLTAAKKAEKIYIINKTDIADESSIQELISLIEETDYSEGKRIIKLSAMTGDGIEELSNAIEEMFKIGNISYNDDAVVSSVRHLELLNKARTSMNDLKNSLSMGLPEDFYSIDLMNAYKALGEIIGESVDEDLINEIFSKFCMGK